MKKITLFIDNLGSGGAQRQLVNMAALLKERNYSVNMLVYSNAPFYNERLEKLGIPITLIEAKGYLSRVLRIRKYLRKSESDAVIAFLEVPGFIACVSKIGGAKWKLITNELSAKESTFKSKRNKFFNKFERYSDAKVCNSYNAMKMWEQHYPKFKEKYSVIYNPVIIPEEFQNKNHAYRSNGKLKITVAASYQELKNPHRVIEAVRLLNDEQKSRLEINWYGQKRLNNGDTTVYDDAIKKISEYQLESCIHLNGETKDIYRIMSESDAVGLFSTVEGLPNAICEGMMLGKPIIMSTVSDYESLTEGNGIFCDPKSVESIRDALIKLLSYSPEELQQMGDKSFEKAKKLFNKDVVCDQWIDLIEKI